MLVFILAKQDIKSTAFGYLNQIKFLLQAYSQKDYLKPIEQGHFYCPKSIRQLMIFCYSFKRKYTFIYIHVQTV